MKTKQIPSRLLFRFLLAVALLVLLSAAGYFALRTGILQRYFPLLFAGPSDPGSRWAAQVGQPTRVANPAGVPVYPAQRTQRKMM